MEEKTDIYATDYRMLNNAKNGDEEAWVAFNKQYRPYLCAIAWKFGVRDCEDVAQLVMTDLVRNFNYDPGRGKFRQWLYSCAKHRILRSKHKENQGPVYPGDEHMPESVVNEFKEIWLAEEREYITGRAYEVLKRNVQPEVYRMFVMLTREGKNPVEVARIFGCTRNVVDTRRCRCMKLLQEYKEELSSDTKSELE